MQEKPEVWQRGPLQSIPPLLQPVAHALLQAAEEVQNLTAGFADKTLWERPANVASPAFHLQHLTGVLDRLFTYAKGQSLTEQQLQYLAAEGDPAQTHMDTNQLVDLFNRRVEISIAELSGVDESTLTEARTIGRKKIPTTLVGLYVHAAEHTMRHVGQLHVTIKILKGMNAKTLGRYF